MTKVSIIGLVLGAAALFAACGNGSGTSGGSGASGGSAAAAAGNGQAGDGEVVAGGGASAGAAGSDVGGAPPVMVGCESNADCEAALGETIPAECAIAKCSATTNECVFTTADADGDGYRAAECSSESVEIEIGEDCDDSNPQAFPGAWDGPGVDGKSDDRCDEVDNDCNGAADDGEESGATCVCDPAADIDVPCDELPDGTAIEWPAGIAKGSCQQGTKTCIDGEWSQCEGAVLPKEMDACDAGNDDDCDGKANVRCPCVSGATRNCGKDTGSCKHGTQTCVNGEWGSACVGEIAAKGKDTCDAGNDDNCNDVPNEGCDCKNGQTATCAQILGSQGACAGGTLTCVGGKWPTSCSITAKAELCDKNGVDENCNGDDRDGCACMNGDTSLNSCGSCGNGYRVCSGGTYENGACYGSSGPYTYYPDGDGDGYCNKSAPTSQCSQPGGYLAANCAADCQDGNGWIPGTTNICSEYPWGRTASRTCVNWFGCGTLQEWQINSGEAPGACPVGTRPQCVAATLSGGGSCWIESESYNGTNWDCRLHPSGNAGVGDVVCAIDVLCIPE